MTSTCHQVRSQLSAFVDGELSGADRFTISRHLEACAGCVEEEQSLRDIGELLRSSAMAAPRVDLTGLSAGVISRARAEQAQSWRAMFARSVEDWHWALVGAGSVTAGVVSILFVSALLWFGPSPSSSDSLESVLDNLSASAGTLFIVSNSPTGGAAPLMRFDNGSMNGDQDQVAIPVSFPGPDETALTAALSDALVGVDGRANGLHGMSPLARKHTEALLNYIQRLRYPPPTGWLDGKVGVLRLGLVTSTICTGKALAP